MVLNKDRYSQNLDDGMIARGVDLDLPTPVSQTSTFRAGGFWAGRNLLKIFLGILVLGAIATMIVMVVILVPKRNSSSTVETQLDSTNTAETQINPGLIENKSNIKLVSLEDYKNLPSNTRILTTEELIDIGKNKESTSSNESSNQSSDSSTSDQESTSSEDKNQNKVTDDLSKREDDSDTSQNSNQQVTDSNTQTFDQEELSNLDKNIQVVCAQKSETYFECKTCEVGSHFPKGDIFSCVTNICVCEFGKAPEHEFCEFDGKKECLPNSCLIGYHFDTTSKLCSQNVCECEYGTAATGSNCLKHGFSKCESCIDSTYALVSQQCVKNTCFCQHGASKIWPNCSKNKAEECTSCFNGYHVNLLDICVEDMCQCENGSPVTHSNCTGHEDFVCQSCNSGYHLSNIDCLINECICQNGTAVANENCKMHLGNQCQSCGNGLKLDPASESCSSIVCTCENGIPVAYTECPGDGEAACGKCDSFYKLVGIECVPKPCSCEHGTPAEICEIENQPLCQTCDQYYHPIYATPNDNTTAIVACEINTCDCENGYSPTEGCTQQDVNECASCISDNFIIFKDKCVDISLAIVEKVCDVSRVDLYLVADGSGSTTEVNYGICVDFFKNLTQIIDIGVNQTSVTLFQFSRTVERYASVETNVTQLDLAFQNMKTDYMGDYFHNNIRTFDTTCCN